MLKSALLSFVTVKLSVCAFSFVAPASMLVGHALTVCAPVSSFTVSSAPGVKLGSSFTAIILKATLALLLSSVPSLDTKAIVPTLVPLRSVVGVNVAASNAAFTFARVPCAVKDAEPLPLPPNVMPASTYC